MSGLLFLLALKRINLFQGLFIRAEWLDRYQLFEFQILDKVLCILVNALCD